MQALFAYTHGLHLTGGSSQERVGARFLRENDGSYREPPERTAHVSKFGTLCVCSSIPCDAAEAFARSTRSYISTRMVRHTLSTTKTHALRLVIRD